MAPPPVRTGRLDVFLLDRRIGWLEYASPRNEMHFSYYPDYLSGPAPAPLSHSLPLQAEPFNTERTTVFFENLLPPDSVRKKLGPILHISRHNIFGFLNALGGDCAGAVSLWPSGQTPGVDKGRLHLLDETESLAVLHSLKKRPLYVGGLDGYRISGAGAQNKLIARIVDGKIALPLFGMPSTHIIKPPVEDYPDSVFNELFAMRLAGRLGLRTAECGLLRLQSEVFYWTERYDREMVGGEIRRLHQEDFCQALGISGELKYESEGGPSFKACMEAMSVMRISLADRLSFIDRMIFNFLIGNADAHGKNSSILYRGGSGRSLAPIYDAMSTAIYPGLSRVNAMSIGGAERFEDVRRDSFASLAAEVGMRPALVLSRLDNICGKIVHLSQSLEKELSVEWPNPVYGKIGAVIAAHVSAVS